jgi:site-specific DNA-cytosine methylase
MRRNENGCDNIATDGTKRKRDFHRQVRVVYRACRRLYGKERTQDECLKLFKIIFPEYYKAKNSNEKYKQLSDESYNKLNALLSTWIPEDGALHDVICYTLNEADRCMLREEFLQFCEDIMPVVMRIRKLTPRECFRLMGVSEPDIDKMLNSGISNSACYKLAGNSIVVDVMTAIFDKLLVNTEQERKAGTQLSLF